MSIGKTTELNLVDTAQLVDGSVTSAKLASFGLTKAEVAALVK